MGLTTPLKIPGILRVLKLVIICFRSLLGLPKSTLNTYKTYESQTSRTAREALRIVGVSHAVLARGRGLGALRVINRTHLRERGVPVRDCACARI
jgi:hypothetical protein